MNDDDDETYAGAQGTGTVLRRGSDDFAEDTIERASSIILLHIAPTEGQA